MKRLDPIIAVKNVNSSSAWYENIFNFKRQHGGEDFSVLVSDENEVMLCLHRWEAHEHPTMSDPNIPVGNGLLLYFRTNDMISIYKNAIEAGCVIEKDIWVNPNSLQEEFSLRDPDGYFLTVSTYHDFQG